MAAKKQEIENTKKRKRIAGSNTTESAANESHTKKPFKSAKKPFDSVKKPFNSDKKPFKSDKKPFKSDKKPFKSDKADASGRDNRTIAPASGRERRLHAKELADARKMKRKRHFTLEQDLARLWEKMRCHGISKEDRTKLVTEALQKMKGKIHEIAGSHISSRVLQTCVKHCSQPERDAVFEELRPHFLALAYNAYAVHLVKKMLDSASKKQLAGFISALHGHIAPLLRHMVGSVVVEHAYELASAAQKQGLLLELYSTEFKLFKDLVTLKESRLLDVMSKLSLQKGSVLRHMASVIQPILEKGIVDHSIIHRVLLEYFSIADQSSVTDIIQQLSSPLLVRMIGTKDGAKIGILCVKYGNAKERKKIIKGLKGHIDKTAYHQYGCLVLVYILSVVDDTKLITKAIIRELQPSLKDLVFDKNGRHLFLQLLHPNCSRYFSPEDLASLNSSIPSFSLKDQSEASAQTVTSEVSIGDKESKDDIEVAVDELNKDKTSVDDPDLAESGKKDPYVRRQELLIKSGLAENLLDICIENVGELIRSNFGKEVLYEVVATGGSDGILHPTLDDKINSLHEAIASLAAESKSEDSQEEHVFENFHSSRTIRKLILDCPNFASTLWEKALKGRSELWAHGHSCKVVAAFLESPDSKVQKLAKNELQPLVDSGILKNLKPKE
ncbi:putative CPL domain-containing protein [Lupinus albus]|uniref:Putative CPL domain-containing protein n=1 Tax=Lupinus albus TaxID=3870 RepID=A0A6A4PIY8_LUPAL|nr:putative CPL domain-containing protein [Lupinus albus]